MMQRKTGLHAVHVDILPLSSYHLTTYQACFKQGRHFLVIFGGGFFFPVVIRGEYSLDNYDGGDSLMKIHPERGSF